MLRTLIVAALALGLSTPVFAETSAQLEILRKIEITADDGTIETVYSPISSAVPGETLFYRITLSNTDPVPATTIGMAVPVDPNLTIDPYSVTGADGLEARFSVDGQTFDSFANLTAEEDGTRRPAEAGDITHIKIALTEIPAESTIFVEYSAFVE